MEERLARIILNAAVRSAVELGNLMPLLKDHASDEFDENLKMPIATNIYEIHHTIIDPVLERFPKLKEEYELNLSQYERSC